MKAPIVYHLCKGFMLRFLWGQGNAESQLTTQWGRVKLCSFDSPRFGEPVCLVPSQQPGKQHSVRIPRQESSVPRASKAAVPEGDSVLPRGLPDGDVQSCRGSIKQHWGWQRLPGELRRWVSESGDGLLRLGPWHGDVDIMVTVPSEMWSKATYPITPVHHLWGFCVPWLQHWNKKRFWTFLLSPFLRWRLGMREPRHLARPIIITHSCSWRWQCVLPFSCLWCSLLAVAICVPSATLLRGLSTYRKQHGGHLIHSQCLEPSIACSTSLTHFSINCPPYKDAVRIKLDSSLTVLAGNSILCMSSCFVLFCKWWYQRQECR